MHRQLIHLALWGWITVSAWADPQLVWNSKSPDWVRVELEDAPLAETWRLDDSYDLLHWRSLGEFTVAKTNGEALTLGEKLTFTQHVGRRSAQHYFRAVKASMPTPKQQLTEARQRWAEAGMEAYSFDYREIGHFGCRHWHVSVREGKRWEFHEVCRDEFFNNLPAPPSIETLFDRIESALEQEPASVRIQYHPILGYPESGYVDFDERIADEEWSFDVPSTQAPAPVSQALDRAEARWKRSQLSEYELRVIYMASWSLWEGAIQVKEGAEPVVELSQGHNTSDELVNGLFANIDAQFAFLREALADGKIVSARFDAELGFPSWMSVDWHKTFNDGPGSRLQVELVR